MPKCILRQFEDEKHFVYFWNLKKGWIQKSHASSINTEQGYYSKQMEEYLGSQIETPFGRVLELIKSIDYLSPNLSMTYGAKEVVLRFAYALFARNPSLLDHIQRTSFVFQFMPEQNQHDLVVVWGMAGAKKCQLLEDFEFTFIENHTEVPFVLPISGLYSAGVDGDISFVFPITPHYAIMFMHKSFVYKYILEGKMCFVKLESSEQAMQLNDMALESEQQNGNYGLAANSRVILEKMKESLIK